MGDKLIEVEYWLSEVGRKASLLSGSDGKGTQVLRVPLTPALLAHASVSENGVARIDLSRGTAKHYDAPIEASEAAVLATVAQLAAEYAAGVAKRERARAEDQVRAAEHVAAWAALPLEDRIYQSGRLWYTRNWPDGADCGASRAAYEEAKAACAQRNVQIAAADEEARARETADREAWIREHGSDRLREALRLGMVECVRKSYADERLAADRPGWRWASEYSGEDEECEVVEPPMAALAAIAAAREVDPETALVWLVDKHESGCEESGGTWDCAPDCHARKRYALALNYRGRRIVRELVVEDPGTESV